MKSTEKTSPHKWLIISALQKSIRMGQSDLALSHAQYLFETDRSYLQYRLGIMLTEDIGIANIDLLNDYLETNISIKNIDSRGGLKFINNIIERACLSNKDRSSCDSAYLASFSGLYSNHNFSNSYSFFLPHIEYLSQIKTLWTLLGNVKYNHDQLLFNIDELPINEKGKKIDNIEKTVSFLKELYLDPPKTNYTTSDLKYLQSPNQFEKLIKVFQLSYNTQRENICLGLPIIYQHFLFESQQNIPHFGKPINKFNTDNFSIFHKPTGLYIPNSSIDLHTSDGKFIAEKFLNHKNNFTQYLLDTGVPSEYALDIFKHMLFRTEGHEVNNRIYFPTAVKVMKDCSEQVLSFKANNKKVSFSALQSILLQELPKFNQYRIDAFAKKNTFKF